MKCGQHVLITGVSTGIGLAVAQHLIEHGYFVFGSVRKEESARKLERELGSNFQALIFDVRDEAAIKQAKVAVANKIGKQPLTAVINNAGIAVHGPLQFLPIEDITRQFDVNVFGTLKVTQAFLELLGARQPAVEKPGKIINISSVSGLFTTPFLTPYSASKHALESITEGLRRELLLYGVDVISVQPGPVKSEIWRKAKEGKNDWDGTVYHPFFRRNHEFIDKIQSKAVPAERIARLINRIIVAKNPKTKYVLTPSPIHLWIHRYLPSRWVDSLYKFAYRKFIALQN